uniref:Uncharacterized protein n=1 Tax=Arundo donax TaxID=35708 RepID=A0A0A8XNI1_ARUDO
MDGADGHEGIQTDAANLSSLDNSHTRSDLNGRIKAGNYAFDEDEDDDHDDYEDEDDDDEFNFVSFKDKRELNFAS